MLYEKILHGAGTTFSHKIYPRFTMPWHYHPEFELTIITSGGGKRFVGDSVDDFQEGDLVLFGNNLPHYHMCSGLMNNDHENISGCEVIQFTKDIFPENIDQMSEFSVICDLLDRSHRGIKFTNPPSAERIIRMMNYMDKLSGVRRVFALFRILEFLGRMKEYTLLVSADYNTNLIGNDANEPVNQVYKYLTNHFMDEVTLEELAKHVNQNPSSLCRHFKKRTQKSIFECLKDIRIGFACKLITNSTLSISQIAYESGYSNIANFNRQFKDIKKLSPTEYRSLFETTI